MKLRFPMFVLLILAVFLSARSSESPVSRDLAGLQFVRVLACDADETGMVTLSCSVAASDDKAIMLRESAPTMTEAVLKMETFTSKAAFFGYTDYLMIGEEGARSSIRECMDYFERDMYLRLGTKLYIVAGGTAGEVVQAVTADGDPLSVRLDTWKNSYVFLPVPKSYTLREVLIALDRSGCAVCPAVQLVAGLPGDESTDVENQGGGDDGKTMKLAGYATFKEQRLATFIGMDQLAAADILLGNTTLIPLSLRLADGGGAALTLLKHQTDYTPVFSEDGRLETLQIDIALSLNLNELYEVTIPIQEAVDELEALVTERMKKDVMRLIDQSQSMGGDWFGFGRTIELMETKKWKNVDWETDFPALRFSVSVKSTISRTYEIVRSLEEPE